MQRWTTAVSDGSKPFLKMKRRLLGEPAMLSASEDVPPSDKTPSASPKVKKGPGRLTVKKDRSSAAPRMAIGPRKTKSLPIPVKVIPFFIGKKGAHIKALQSEFSRASCGRYHQTRAYPSVKIAVTTAGESSMVTCTCDAAMIDSVAAKLSSAISTARIRCDFAHVAAVDAAQVRAADENDSLSSCNVYESAKEKTRRRIENDSKHRRGAAKAIRWNSNSEKYAPRPLSSDDSDEEVREDVKASRAMSRKSLRAQPGHQRVSIGLSDGDAWETNDCSTAGGASDRAERRHAFEEQKTLQKQRKTWAKKRRSAAYKHAVRCL
jgi:hypothetical protein